MPWKTRTLIFDREEKEAGALSGQKGTYVELTDISKDLQNAVVATEDRSFYKNDGINYGRFFLAILTAGRSGGGSTITQQLAKKCLSFPGPDRWTEGQGVFPCLRVDKEIQQGANPYYVPQ